jgi:uncharacterized protein YqeY
MKTKIDEDLKQAMRDKNQTKLNVLRGLKSAFTNASLQKGNVDSELSDIEIINIVRKQFSQRQDSIKQFIDGQRLDLVAKEEVEMEILKEYLPTELDDGDLAGIVWSAIQEYENPTKKDMGAIIKKVVEIVNGRADNKRISKMVGEKLS